CADRADAGVHAKMIKALFDPDATGSQRPAFGRDLDVGCRSPWRIQCDVDGKALAAKNLRGQAQRFEAQVGLRAAGERVCIDGNAELARLPGCTHNATEILIAV